MKTRFISFYAALIFLFFNCGDNLAAANAKRSADSPAASLTKNLAPTPITSDDGIIGTWKLIMEAYDENDNKKLDDEERKMGMKNSTPQTLHNYQMQFNANGSCKIEPNYAGTYKINEEGSNKILSVQLDATERLPPGNQKYYIKSMTSSELLLLREVSGVTYTFWLFKKA